MPSIQPKDIIAFIGVIGIFITQFAGVASTLESIIALAIGFYVGHRKSRHDIGQ